MWLRTLVFSNLYIQMSSRFWDCIVHLMSPILSKPSRTCAKYTVGLVHHQAHQEERCGAGGVYQPLNPFTFSASSPSFGSEGWGHLYVPHSSLNT